MRKFTAIFVAAATMSVAMPAVAQQEPPYWASIDAAEARMRTGPSTEYPTMWIYRRERMPVKIITRYKAWRKIEDSDGTQGWMHAKLLSNVRSAMVQGTKGAVFALRSQPNSNASITWRVEPGVVGRITQCEGGWCLFDVTGRRGYVQTSIIWGDELLKPAK